jgi:hypothetical protein
VRQVAMLLLLAVRDGEFASSDALPLGFFEAEGGCQIETLESALEIAPIRTRVEQSADSHVAADAGKRVKITNFQKVTRYQFTERGYESKYDAARDGSRTCSQPSRHLDKGSRVY